MRAGLGERTVSGVRRAIERHGWRRATMERIAAAAGLSRMTLHRNGVIQGGGGEPRPFEAPDAAAGDSIPLFGDLADRVSTPWLMPAGRRRRDRHPARRRDAHLPGALAAAAVDGLGPALSGVAGFALAALVLSATSPPPRGGSAY